MSFSQDVIIECFRKGLATGVSPRWTTPMHCYNSQAQAAPLKCSVVTTLLWGYCWQHCLDTKRLSISNVQFSHFLHSVTSTHMLDCRGECGAGKGMAARCMQIMYQFCSRYNLNHACRGTASWSRTLRPGPTFFIFAASSYPHPACGASTPTACQQFSLHLHRTASVSTACQPATCPVSCC